MIKKLLKRILYPNHHCNKAYVNFLRKGGAKVGERTFFYSPKSRPVDETSLPFVEIGSNCRITAGTTILAHDYSYAVLRPIYHEMFPKVNTTIIGNNVFIGLKSTVMPGAHIGDNVIIGAGSVVTGKIPSNVIVAGNPAKIIMTLDDYHNKLKSNFIKNAKLYFLRKKKYLGRLPYEKEMLWFIALWKPLNAHDIYNEIRVDGDNKEDVVKDQLNVLPVYDSYEAFIKECLD